MPLAATYLLSGLGILAYKSKLEQSGSDYVANQQAQMNALMMSPTADYYTQLGVWTINSLTTKPVLPDSSTGFPGSYEVPGKTPKHNGKGARKRWKIDDGKILDWDCQHGEVEMYTKNGKHLGAYDPDTGMKKKDAKKERNIKKFL